MIWFIRKRLEKWRCYRLAKGVWGIGFERDAKGIIDILLIKLVFTNNPPPPSVNILMPTREDLYVGEHGPDDITQDRCFCGNPLPCVKARRRVL